MGPNLERSPRHERGKERAWRTVQGRNGTAAHLMDRWAAMGTFAPQGPR